MSLSTFLARAPEVEPPERAALLALAQALLTDVYVHRQQKQARYGIDPVQQLRVLRQRMQQLSTRQFHDELTSIFTALRERAGLPLEDIGVAVDEVHEPTRADLTHSNRDMLRAAVRLLSR